MCIRDSPKTLRAFKTVSREIYTDSRGTYCCRERINELLDEEIEIKDSIYTQQLSRGILSKDYKFKGKIEFRNVNFFYNEGEHVIKDLSF